MPLVTFTANTPAEAAEVNANFALCVLTDTAKTVTVTHTWTASQTFTGGLTTGASSTLGGHLLFTDATYDIGASGATRPRDLYLSRNAVFGGTINVTGTSTLAAANGTIITASTRLIADELRGQSGGTNIAFSNNAGTELVTINKSSGLLTALFAVTATGLLTASAGATIASGQTLTLTGATVAGTPTWSSSQAITLSTAAQPNITSVGTLTSLSVGAITSTGLLKTTLTSQQLALHYDANNHCGVSVSSAGVVTIAATAGGVAGSGTIILGTSTNNVLGFYGDAGTGQPTITGSRGGNAALESLLAALAAFGLIVDSTS